MVAAKQSTMGDRRALLTDREREIVAGEADVTDDYRYQTISRVRARFDRLAGDIEAMEKHGALADDLRERVCSDLEGDPASVDIAGGDSSDAQTERQTPVETVEPEPESHSHREAAERAVDQNWKETWDGRREDAVRDLLGLFDWLADQDGAQQKGDFLEQYPKFAGPYPSEEFPQAGGKKGSWWRNYVSECLDDMPGVDRSGQNGRRWACEPSPERD